MLVTRNLQPSLWESVLPAEVRRMAPLLEQVDRWLDDEAFFAPFREHFRALLGRASIPMEVYLRMMFLKFQYKLGYESLCREVSDSISWRIFCRLNLDGSVPAPSTLSKITTRCGENAVLRAQHRDISPGRGRLVASRPRYPSGLTRPGWAQTH
jgi:IS5 family transposase